MTSMLIMWRRKIVQDLEDPVVDSDGAGHCSFTHWRLSSTSGTDIDNIYRNIVIGPKYCHFEQKFVILLNFPNFKLHMVYRGFIRYQDVVQRGFASHVKYSIGATAPETENWAASTRILGLNI